MMRKAFPLKELFATTSLHGINSQDFTSINATLDKDVGYPMLGSMSMLKGNAEDVLVGVGHIKNSPTNINAICSSMEASSPPHLL